MHKTNESGIVTPLKGQVSARDRKDILQTPGLLAKFPLIGFLMVVLGGIAFGAIALNLQSNGPLVQSDVSIANSIHAAALQSSSFVRELMIFGFFLGEHGIVAIGALLALYFLFKRRWPELCMVAVAWPGEGSIWLILSNYYHRPRPVFEVPVWHVMTSPGFPSGHTMSAVMCFGLLAYLLLPRILSSFWRTVVIVISILIMFYIGYSRLFVGDHYLSDVLAGYALGIAWSGLVYTFVELIFKKRIKRYV